MVEKDMFLSGCAKQADNYIWVSLTEFNGLVKIDIHTGEVFFVGEFPLENRSYQIHYQICECDNKLFFSPWNTNNIAVYDLGNGEFRKISMEDCGCLTAGRVVTVVQKDENLFFILENAREIIEFDIRREVIKKKHVLLEEDAGMEPFSYMRPIKTQHNVWGISEKSGVSWQFDLSSGICRKIKLFDENRSIYTGCGSNDYIWLLAENSVLYQMMPTGERDKEYDLSEILKCKLDKLRSDMEDEERNHFSSIFLKNRLFIIWFEKKEIIQIPFNGETAVLNEYKVDSYDRAEFSYGDQLIVSMNNKMIVFDGESTREIEIRKTPDFTKDILKVPNKKLIEGSCIQLYDLLAHLEQHEGIFDKSKDDEAGTVGSQIYSEVK